MTNHSRSPLIMHTSRLSFRETGSVVTTPVITEG